MDYIHFLDNNIFRLICSSPNGEALNKLFNSISGISFLNEKTNFAFKLSPFSILEAIGIVPPRINDLALPNELIQLKDAAIIAEYLSSLALKFYQKSEEISLANIQIKAHEQEKYVTAEAKEIFGISILDIINEAGFVEYLQRQLVMDYLFKFDYPNEIDKIMIPFFGAQFFMNDNISSNISKFRLAKKISNIYYNRIQHNCDKEFLFTLQRAMNIDKHQDYVDCDLIHFACMGALNNNERCPVISYSIDKPEVIIPRIKIYKSIIELFKIGITESNPTEMLLPSISMAEGIFAFCSTEGNVYEVAEVGRIGKLL
ncbi:MAG: hypothetical protein ACM3P0_14150 [Acidobacteriota bacterium]